MTTKTQQPDVVRPNRQPACIDIDRRVELQRDVTSPGRGEDQVDVARIGGKGRVGLRDRTVAVGTSEDRPAEQRRELRRG